MLLFLTPCPRTEFIQPSREINLELTPDLSRGFIVQVMMCSQHCCIPMIIYHARTQTVQKLKLKELKEALYMYIFLFCAVFIHLLTSYTFLCPVWTRHSLSRLVLHLYAKQIHKWLSLAAACLAFTLQIFQGSIDDFLLLAFSSKHYHCCLEQTLGRFLMEGMHLTY